MGTERLSKYVARSGLASRRKSEEIIKSGRIKVNGETVIDPFRQIDLEKDLVAFEGRQVRPMITLQYIVLHKPPGYISDLKDPRGRKVARDLITVDAPLFPVGRLDYNSEGLIIFTNDGDFANRLMHPRYEVEKEYEVKLSGKLTREELARMVAGVRIEGDIYRVKSIAPLRQLAKNAWYRVIVTEGKNRMIRKLADALAHPVLRLRRIRIAHITLGELKPGEFRQFHGEKIKALTRR